MFSKIGTKTFFEKIYTDYYKEVVKTILSLCHDQTNFKPSAKKFDNQMFKDQINKIP